MFSFGDHLTSLEVKVDQRFQSVQICSCTQLFHSTMHFHHAITGLVLIAVLWEHCIEW